MTQSVSVSDFVKRYPEFSRRYWQAIKEKGSWFQQPSEPLLDFNAIEEQEVVVLAENPHIRDSDVGETFAHAIAYWKTKEIVIELWGRSASYLSKYTCKDTSLRIDFFQTETVEGVLVVLAKISDIEE